MRKSMFASLALAFIVVGAVATAMAGAQQPTFGFGEGPTICIDEAHFNMHSASGTYSTVAEIWRADGYVVEASTRAFASNSLQACSVLVIANALHERNRLRGDATDWSLPNPSAFTPNEIAVVRDWVRDGGALLLIADHMPFPGAAADLAAAFDVQFNNGFAMEMNPTSGTLVFRRSAGLLPAHPITDGRSAAGWIDSVTTDAGQAFQVNGRFDPLLVIPEGVVSLMPEVAWEFTDDTPRIPVGGWLQGAAAQFGDGRLVVFGEASQFRPGDDGESFPGQNGQFALNVIRWLSGILDER